MAPKWTHHDVFGEIFLKQSVKMETFANPLKILSLTHLHQVSEQRMNLRLPLMVRKFSCHSTKVEMIEVCNLLLLIPKMVTLFIHLSLTHTKHLRILTPLLMRLKFQLVTSLPLPVRMIAPRLCPRRQRHGCPS